jgi:hypothetical protein
VPDADSNSFSAFTEIGEPAEEADALASAVWLLPLSLAAGEPDTEASPEALHALCEARADSDADTNTDKLSFTLTDADPEALGAPELLGKVLAETSD